MGQKITNLGEVASINFKIRKAFPIQANSYFQGLFANKFDYVKIGLKKKTLFYKKFIKNISKEKAFSFTLSVKVG